MEDQSIQSGKFIIIFKHVLWCGLLVGFLDGTAAIISAYLGKGTNPLRVFQFIASGIFGKDAFTGGYWMATIGFSLHFIISLGWAALFFFLYPRFRILAWNKIIVGMAYGILVLLAMKFLVLPLSNVPMINPGKMEPQQIIIHMLLVGLPISILANRFYSKN